MEQVASSIDVIGLHEFSWGNLGIWMYSLCMHSLV